MYRMLCGNKMTVFRAHALRETVRGGVSMVSDTIDTVNGTRGHNNKRSQSMSRIITLLF